MKGILVHPAVSVYGWDSYYREGRRNCSLPHGLLSVATEANRCGHDVRILDLRRYATMERAVGEALIDDPEFIGCGAMTVDFDVSVEFLKQIKQKAPQITTVMGGVHASVAPEDAEAHPEIDYIVRGEGEWTLTRMLDECFVGFERVTQGECPDLDTLLPPDRELIDYADGELTRGGSWNSSYPYVTIMVGRGCPHRCAFCWPVSETVFGQRARMRSVEHVMWELRFLSRRYQPAYIEFIDDNFTMKPSWVGDFVKRYPRICGHVPFNVASRADTIVRHPGMFEALRNVGLDTVNVGLESGCQRHLDFLKKGTTVEQNHKACATLKDLGLKIVGNVIFGIPGETPSETMQTVRLCREHDVDFVSPAFFTPYPGCALHAEYGSRLRRGERKHLHRHATTPKIEGVDYGPITAILQAEGIVGR